MTSPSEMQAAVDQLAAGLGRSVLVEDHDQRPVWWSTYGVVDQTRTKTILNRRVEPGAAAVVDRYRLTRATKPVRTPPMPAVGMWARWCMPVRHEGRLLGFLWVLDPQESLGEEDLQSLIDCAEMAGAALAKERQTAESTRLVRDELLARLLCDRDEDAARELARLEHIAHDAPVQVQVPRRPGGWDLPDDMSAHTATGRPWVATSGQPLPLVELGEAVRRARATRRAVEAGARPDPDSWDGLGAWHLVIGVPPTVSVEQIYPAAAALAEQPRDDLLVTARTVVDHGGDIVAAAQELHVHRTTLYYRLNRIAELTGADLHDGPTRTHLQMALWLAAYRAAT